MLLAGLTGGAVAAPFGFLDWLKIPSGSRAKRIGAMHGGGNVLVFGCFLASWLLRDSPPASPEAMHIALSLIGAGMALVTAWLGGELWYATQSVSMRTRDSMRPARQESAPTHTLRARSALCGSQAGRAP